MVGPQTTERARGRHPRASFRHSLALWSLLGLGMGLVLGLAAHSGAFGGIRLLASAIAPFGQLWLNALQLVVLPLVVTQMLMAVTNRQADAALGALSLRTIGLIIVFLTLGGAFTVLVGPPALRLFRFDPAAVDAALHGVVVPDVAARAAGSAGAGWIAGLIPANVLEAGMNGNVLGVLLFAVGFGLAVNRLPDSQREPLSRLFAGAADAMLQLVRWILIVTPIGVFALVLEMSINLGFDVIGILGAWVVFVSALLILFTGLLYPLTSLLGRAPLRTFARAVAPAQIVAFGTRSSLACLPALVEQGREHLRLPPATTGFVLPLCVTVFKQNRTISSTAKLLFLAHVFGISLAAGDVIIFFLTVLLLSFSAVGVPRGGAAFSTLPAYLAAGLPIQGVVILESVETVPDFFKTVLNTTADMSIAAVTARHLRVAAVEAAPAPAPEYVEALP
jgi:proton glutamate symport protein